MMTQNDLEASIYAKSLNYNWTVLQILCFYQIHKVAQA